MLQQSQNCPSTTVGSLGTSQPSILSANPCCGFPRDMPTLTPLSHPSGCHDKAVLLYEYVGKRIVDLQHTEVPDAYRGRGIAKHLAKVRPSHTQGQELVPSQLWAKILPEARPHHVGIAPVPCGNLALMGDGAAGRADGNLGSGIPVSCGRRSWESVSKSSHSLRFGPFLLSAENPHAGADGSPQLKLDPFSPTFTALVNPLPALGCAGRAEEP